MWFSIILRAVHRRRRRAGLYGLLGLLLLALAGLGSIPVTGAPLVTVGVGVASLPAATLVMVRDDAGAPVGGAEVYQNCTYRGLTNASGQLTLAGAAAGDRLQVRKLVYTGSTNKANHGAPAWAYHVWLTNIVQHDNGSQSYHLVTNPGATQEVVTARQNAQIGFNVVASVAYNASPANLNDIALGLSREIGRAHV